MASGWLRVFVCRECGEASITGRLEVHESDEVPFIDVVLTEVESIMLARRWRVTPGICWVCLSSVAPANDEPVKET